MKSQSISSRLLKTVMMGLVMAALLLSLKVSASAAMKIYPYSNKTNVITKGFKYQLSYSSNYYTFKSTKPSVVSVNKNGLITAKKKGSCRIHVYFKSSGNYCIGYSFKVKANKHIGKSYKSIKVKNCKKGKVTGYLSKAYIRGKYLHMDWVFVNRSNYNISRCKELKMTFYVGGKKICKKTFNNLHFKLKNNKKKKLSVKFKLNKATAKRMDLNRANIWTYYYFVVY